MKRSSFDIHLISFIFSIIGKAISAVLLSETFNVKLELYNYYHTQQNKVIEKKWSSYLISQIFSLTYVMGGGGVVRCDSWFYKQTHRKLWMHCWCEKKMHHQAWNLSSNCWIKDNVQYFHDSGTHFSCTSIVKW